MTRLIHACVLIAIGFLASGAQAQNSTTQAGRPTAKEAEQVVKVFQLKHATADEMQRIVLDLFGRVSSQQNSYTRGRSPNLAIRTSSDPRTNSLIVIGKPSDLTVIEALVERLDTPATDQPKNTIKVSTLSKLDQRVDRLERELARLRASAARSRFGGSRSSNIIVAPPVQTSTIATVAGTPVRIEAQSPKGGALRVVSIVPAGKSVKTGDLLLKLDTAPFEAAIDEQTLKVERAQADVIQSEVAVRTLLIQLDTRAVEGKLQVELAKLSLTEFQEGTRPLELIILEKDVTKCKLDLDEQNRIVAAGNANARSLEKLKVELDVAQKKLAVFQKFTIPKTIKELESAIVLAERKSQQDLRSAKAEVTVSQANLESTRIQMDVRWKI